MLTGRRVAAPWKITSSILPPRSRRADCSPSTHRTASDTFDLPQPLGPTMAVTPDSKVNSTVSANDLKPESSSFVSFIAGSCAGKERSGRRRAGPADDEGRHAKGPTGRIGLLARTERPHDDTIYVVG